MAVQRIEQLTLQELKQAFRKYLIERRDREFGPAIHVGNEWHYFWKHLEKKCSVVETIT